MSRSLERDVPLHPPFKGGLGSIFIPSGAGQRAYMTRLKVPSWEGREGFSLQGWVPVGGNPPLHPSG